MTETYIVRVQLIRLDEEGEHLSGSFDYELEPSSQPHEDPTFMRAWKFYNQIQDSFKASGKVTVTNLEGRIE